MATTSPRDSSADKASRNDARLSFNDSESSRWDGSRLVATRFQPEDADHPDGEGRQLDTCDGVEGGEKWGRYSFLGANPSRVFRCKGRTVTILKNGEEEQSKPRSVDRPRFVVDFFVEDMGMQHQTSLYHRVWFFNLKKISCRFLTLAIFHPKNETKYDSPKQ